MYDYTVIPVNLLDATVANTDIIARVSIVVDAPLSLTKLQSSWYRVLQARPRIRARIRRSSTASSGLEYHIPTSKNMTKYLESQRNTPNQLKDLFCLDESHRSIADYCPGWAVGSRAPKPPCGVFVSDSASPADQKRCMTYNAAESFNELINKDRPVNTVQATLFRDATLLTISESHVSGDIFTIKDMFKAWAEALHGMDIAPLKEGELRSDPFSAYGPGGKLAGDRVLSDNPSLPPGWRVYGEEDKRCLAERVERDCSVTRPERTISQKCVWVSDDRIRALADQAKRDLFELEKRNSDTSISSPDTALRVSISSVLHAWLLQQTHTHPKPTEHVAPMTIFNARARPPTGMRPKGSTTTDTESSNSFPTHEMFNASLPISLPPMTISQMLSMPLGELALQIRDGTAEGTTPENTRRLLAYTLNNTLWKKPSGTMALFSAPDHTWHGFSDCRVAKLHELDFTPALPDIEGYDGRGSGSGSSSSSSNPSSSPSQRKVSVSAYHTNMSTAFTQRDRWFCMGHAMGGVWFVGFASEGQWDDKRGIGRFPRLRLNKRVGMCRL